MTRKDLTHFRRAQPADVSYREKFIKPAKTAKRYATPRIPEDIQAPLRRRLRLAREGLGLHLSQMRGNGIVEKTTLSKYETNDISTMTMATLCGIAHRFGWTLNELLTYLASGEQKTSPRSANMARITTYSLRLSPKAQEVACDFLRVLVDYDEAQRA